MRQRQRSMISRVGQGRQEWAGRWGGRAAAQQESRPAIPHQLTRSPFHHVSHCHALTHQRDPSSGRSGHDVERFGGSPAGLSSACKPVTDKSRTVESRDVIFIGSYKPAAVQRVAKKYYFLVKAPLFASPSAPWNGTGALELKPKIGPKRRLSEVDLVYA